VVFLAEIPKISPIHAPVGFDIGQLSISIGGKDDAFTICLIHIEPGLQSINQVRFQVYPVLAPAIGYPHMSFIITDDDIVLTAFPQVLHPGTNPGFREGIFPTIHFLSFDIKIIHPVIIQGYQNTIIPVAIVIEYRQSIGGFVLQFYRVAFHIPAKKVDQVYPVLSIKKVLHLTVLVVVNGMHIAEYLFANIQFPVDIPVIVDKIHIVQGIEGNDLQVVCPVVFHKIWLPVDRCIKVSLPDGKVFFNK